MSKQKAFAFIFDGHDSGTIQAEYDIKSSDINVVENISQKVTYCWQYVIFWEIHSHKYEK